jgi:hypothetical protein
VILVEPPENHAYRSEVRIGTRSWDEGWRHANGLRFIGVAVPQDAFVTSARLSLRYKYHTGMPVKVYIHGEAVDSSAPFTSDNTLAHQRLHTEASITWNMDFAPTSGMWFDSPGIAPLVQEIVNRSGWSVYNALSVLIESAPDTAHYIDAWAYDHDPQLAVKMEICYQSGSAPIATATPTPTPRPGTTIPTRPPSPGTKQGLTWPYSSSISASKVADAGAKAVQDWGYHAANAIEAINAGLIYYPVQFNCSLGETSVDEPAIRAFINSDPNKLKGLTWLAFNEPEWPYQAGCSAEQAARAFHKLDQVLRRGSNPADPTAKLYCCGNVNTDVWTGFMADFRAAYYSAYAQNPPLDGVNLHLYNGPIHRLDWCRLETNLDDFRDWQQNQSWIAGKPAVVSEWGVLSNSTEHPTDTQAMVGNCSPGCYCDVMARMWDVFEYSDWVQHHLWWTTYSTGNASEFWDTGNIFTDCNGTQLTDPVGQKYRALSTGS